MGHHDEPTAPAYQTQPYGQPQAYQAQPYGQPQAYAQPQSYSQSADIYVDPSQPILGNAAYGDKFPQRPRYRDLLFGILFFLHLAAVLVILGVSYKHKESLPTYTNSTSTYQYTNGTDSSSDSTGVDMDFFADLRKVLAVILVSAAAALVFAVLYIRGMKKFAGKMIVVTLIMSVVMWAVMAVVFFVQANLVAGIVFLVVAVFNALIYFAWRRRIPFAQAVLSSVAHVIDAYPAPTYVSYISVFVLFGWTALWMATVSFAQSYSGDGSTILLIFLIFSFYWTTQVIKNVVHVTTSGLVASWYFFSGTEAGMPGSPTLGALKRACTTSFGSIALGSLLVALLKTLRQVVQSAGQNTRSAAGAILACIAVCLLGILDSLLQYFNMYAFTQVAIYGKSFCEASKDTWALIKSHGFAAVINDNLISGVLMMGALLGGVFTAVVGAVVGRLIIPESWVILAIFAFLIGFCLVSLTMEVVESSVATTFVCFAMEPAILQRNNPDLHRQFVTTYNLTAV